MKLVSSESARLPASPYTSVGQICGLDGKEVIKNDSVEDGTMLRCFIHLNISSFLTEKLPFR